MQRASCWIFEGTWWGPKEVPQLLKYFDALRETNRDALDLSYRTIHSGEDLAHYLREIPKGQRAFVYIACHGEALNLCPSRQVTVSRVQLQEILGEARECAIQFLHLGCCHMIDAENRRSSHEEIATRLKCASWVSGYTTGIDWHRSVLLDLMLVFEVYLDFYYSKAQGGHPKLALAAKRFRTLYQPLARHLGFSALTRDANGRGTLIPGKLK